MRFSWILYTVLRGSVEFVTKVPTVQGSRLGSITFTRKTCKGVSGLGLRVSIPLGLSCGLGVFTGRLSLIGFSPGGRFGCLRGFRVQGTWPGLGHAFVCQASDGIDTQRG